MDYSIAALDAETSYIRDISRFRVLKFDDEVNLARASRQGCEHGRQAMIRHNLRLVVSMARRYRNRGLALMDLVEEGNLGLITAVDKYDPERGYRFSTYATWWIRQNIERAIMNHARNVRLPVHVIKNISQCRRQQQKLYAELGREPSRTELAEYVNMPLATLDALLDCHESSQDAAMIVPEPDELCAREYLDRISPVDPAEHIYAESRDRTLKRWVSALNKRQRAVIERRYGLNGHKADTLENVGLEICLTRERVRQLQIEGLRRLRRMANAEGCDLDSFL
ncbi:sigma-70 family RNA polymerase sigma factor [Pseudohongiella spirulinae]|uniref:RNA polymerase sigma factor n=1 Tax=Pseudohongiella spirulinae TaxID=1249552 RepID=A0A0S2KCP5_9GAMM|nr:sigma-70 family RNA polymerase sigma factor [Pseudohongiella spirulinae]ALO46065.1 RNA polymerase sigma factor [Pseudohongiella spirulinae]